MTKKLLLTFLLVLGVILILAACAPTASPASTTAATSSSSGSSTTIDAKALVEIQCVQCHGLDRVESKKSDAAGWTKIVDRMMAKGGNITYTADEKAAVIAYLAETYK